MAVVLLPSQGRPLPSTLLPQLWKFREPVLVITVIGGCPWHLVGRNQGCLMLHSEEEHNAVKKCPTPNSSGDPIEKQWTAALPRETRERENSSQPELMMHVHSLIQSLSHSFHK